MIRNRYAGFEHGREVCGLIARKTKVRRGQGAFERRRGARAPVVPGRSQALGKTLEALARARSTPSGHHGRGNGDTAPPGFDARLPGGLGKCETGGTFLRNEVRARRRSGPRASCHGGSRAVRHGRVWTSSWRRFSAFGARETSTRRGLAWSAARGPKGDRYQDDGGDRGGYGAGAKAVDHRRPQSEPRDWPVNRKKANSETRQATRLRRHLRGIRSAKCCAACRSRGRHRRWRARRSPQPAACRRSVA